MIHKYFLTFHEFPSHYIMFFDAHFKFLCKLLLPVSVSILVCFSVKLILFEERDKSNNISSFLKEKVWQFPVQSQFFAYSPLR